MCRLSELGIKVRSVLTPRGQGSSQLSGSAQLSSKDASFSKAEAKNISKINNISEVLILFMFTIYSTPQLVGDNCNHYVVLTRKLFVLPLARLPELLWKIIHGVIQLAFSATQKLI